MPIAASSETKSRPTAAGSDEKGQSSRSKRRRSAALNRLMTAAGSSGDVAQAAEALLDLLLVLGALELGELLLEGVGDELLRGGVAGQVGVALDLGHQVLVELHGLGREHGFSLRLLTSPRRRR